MSKERPILFSAPMVRAILEGRKTQTRRIAPITEVNITSSIDTMSDKEFCCWDVQFSKPQGPRRVTGHYSGGFLTRDQSSRVIASMFCPYGKPGDRLWVRETWGIQDEYPCQREGEEEGKYQLPKELTTAPQIDYWAKRICYRADGENPPYKIGGWKPSIHMYRWSSRIDLCITGVRVERLRDITAEDAVAEGIKGRCIYAGTPLQHDTWSWEDYPTHHLYDTPIYAYRALWQEINGVDSWNENPWVWVVEFEVVKR